MTAKTMDTESFCLYGFDQQMLIWYVFRLRDMVFRYDVSSVSPSSEQFEPHFR